LIYLQTLKLLQHLSRDDRRHTCHQAKNYLIISDTLYCRGVDDISCRCLNHEEVEDVLNECDGGECGGHLSMLLKTQNILRVDYFWPSIFKYCVEAVKTCHSCQVFSRKMHSHPSLTQSSPSVPSPSGGGFYGLQPNLGRHQHIIVAVDYFTKWAEAMPTIKSNGKTANFFIFNQIISRFIIPKEIVTDHGSHFQNEMMKELASKLGFKHDHSSPYYLHANGHVEVVNKSLKTILQKNVSQSKYE
jgi:hypothetical protein